MKIFYFLMQHSRRLLVLAIVAGVVSGAANTGLLAIINSALNNDSTKSKLVVYFIGLCLLVPASRILAELMLAYLGQGALFQLRLELSRQILGVPLRKLEELGPHRLMAALTDDVPTLTNVVTMIPVLCINIAVAISCLLYMAWLSLPMFGAVIALIVIGIISYQLPVAKSFQYMQLARRESNNLYNHFRALTEGIKELKTHSNRRRAFLNEVLRNTAANFKKHNLAGQRIYTIAASWGQLLVFVVIGMLIFSLAGWISVERVVLSGFTFAVLFLMTPLQVIMNTLPNMGRATVALKNVNDLGLSLTASNTEKDADEKLLTSGPVWQSIELCDVTHTYKHEDEEIPFVLGPINLNFRAGELVFVTGGNGSGKTTLAKLMIGLYTPEDGQLRLNGEIVTDEMMDHYRQHFSVVFSDFYLFDTFLGLKADELDDTAREYLRQLQLDHKVDVKDGALSTTSLSQGQRKRLALLTAYLEDRPIYVFDEWAADQDPYFKEIFYHHLLPELKANGKTVIAITHDDRYYDVGDRVIKLESGKIVYDESVIIPETMHRVAAAPVL